MPPQVLPRVLNKFMYTGDDGSQEEIQMSAAIGLSVGNNLTTNRIEYSIKHSRLRLLNLRYQDDPDAKVYRKRVVICDLGNPLWTGAAATVDIGGDIWTVTSRTAQKIR